MHKAHKGSDTIRPLAATIDKCTSTRGAHHRHLQSPSAVGAAAVLVMLVCYRVLWAAWVVIIIQEE